MDKKTMRGLMIYGKGDYRYETNIPIPQVGPDDILIKSEGSGVCASDVKCWHGASSYWGGDGIKPWVQAPFIPGHEFLGVVAGRAFGDLEMKGVFVNAFVGDDSIEEFP